ncbi:MAG: peptidoglycan editing factor PgeF [Aggregatilineales bacterium]
MERIVRDKLVYYRFDNWDMLKHGVFTRLGGVSQSPWDTLNVGGTMGDNLEAVRQNHQLMYDAVGANQERACTTWLVHSVDVVVVDSPVIGRKWQAIADGMITNQPDTPLVMRYADCTPLLFFDRAKQVIGISHAGWRGTVGGIASRTIHALEHHYGCIASDIEVGIGPCIGARRYQVGDEVVDAVVTYFGDTDGLICRDERDGTAYFDLVAANKRDLERVGVEKIATSGICTAENTQEFFSHRAEKGRTGRFGVVISL